MTTGTSTPYRSGLRAGRDGFAQLLRAEWTKFRTVRGWVIGMIVAAVVMDLVGLFAAGNSSGSCSNGPGTPTLSGRACLPYIPTGPGGEAVTDSFYFVRQPLSGNGSITVRVTSLTGLHFSGNAQVSQGPLAGMSKGLVPWAKAGIIIKASTKAGFGVCGDDGHRRPRGAVAVRLHPGHCRPAGRCVRGIAAVAAADPLR